MDHLSITFLPKDPHSATKYLLDQILIKIHPQVVKTRKRFQDWDGNEEDIIKIRDVYTLSLSQIKKCLLHLFEVFRLEFGDHILLQETRQCTLERLTWCFNRLISIDDYLESLTQDNSNVNEGDNSFNVTIMYFVNWIDDAFEILNKLAEIIYKTDYKEDLNLYEQWKNNMVEYVGSLHISIDELLLTAMTLCRYCLPSDQHIVKARSQVVLRETKALISELIEGDPGTVKISTEALKLPIMPSNVNVMIDVLKDVLYVLETNTNTALLTLLIHCFSNNQSPVDVIKQHFMKAVKGVCSCEKVTGDVSEDCLFVKEFDLYNERLLQIGSFAVSCSCDQNRILTLRSGLASLEALDPHLVPAVMTSPSARHTSLLVKSWKQELQEIRDSVFLIVDPAAFADKSKQMMHQKLLEVLKQSVYNNVDVCQVINIGSVVHDFFAVYNKLEPDALPLQDKLMPLLADLFIVQTECKVVSNLFCKSEDFTYDVKKPKQQTATLEQLYKRLKLLYTLVTRINGLLQPKEKDELFENDFEENMTRTILKNGQTYVNSPKKANVSRSIFARTNVRSSTRNFPLSKLTKHLRGKNCSQLNFSVELNRLLNDEDNGIEINKHFSKARESMYNFSPIKNRSSMRKVILNRHLSNMEIDSKDEFVENVSPESLLNNNESLQLTEVLNDMYNTTIATMHTQNINQTAAKSLDKTKNFLSININNHNSTFTKQIWNIPINTSEENTPIYETSTSSNTTQPSTITTLERINDLDYVETKLNSLKSQFETSL